MPLRQLLKGMVDMGRVEEGKGTAIAGSAVSLMHDLEATGRAATAGALGPSRLRSTLLAVLLSAATVIALMGAFAAAAEASPGFAYVTNEFSDSVTPIELATNKAGAEIKVGEEPVAIAITPDGKTAYVVNEGNASVTPIELATNKAGAEIKVGELPVAIAIAPNGKTAYVTNFGSHSVTPIEVASNKAGAEIKVSEPPYGIAITPNGKTAYVTNIGNESVTPIELATNTVGAEVKVGKEPVGIGITPDSKTAYVANAGSESVTPIEVASNKAGAEIKVGKEPARIAITPNGKTAYVTNEFNGSVTPIEVASNKAGAEIKVGILAVGIAITPEAPPTNVSLPEVVGTPRVGDILECNKGTWTGEPTGYAYQWLRNGVPIAGATTANYTVEDADRGNSLACEVTASNEAGKTSATSSAVEVAQVLEQVPGSPFANTPSAGVAFAPKGALLASANYGANNVSMFSVNESTGALTPVSGSPFSTGAGSEPRALAFEPEQLVTADAGTDTVSYFTVNESTGLLTPVGLKGSWYKTEKDPVSIACEPTGSFCATANKGSGDISVFSPSKAVAAPGSPFAAGEAPDSVAYQPATPGEPSKLLAAGNQSSDSISMYAVNKETNALTPASGSPVFIGKPVFAVAFNEAGTLLAAATSEGVEMFTVSGDGALTPVPGSPFDLATSFQSVAFNPNGESLVAVNTKTNQVSAFLVSPSTGALSQIASSPFSAQGEPFSVAFNPEGDLFALGSLKEKVAVFNALFVVTIKPAAAVTKASATLTANVNINGLNATEFSECVFEYGTTHALGSSKPCTPASGKGSPTKVSAAISGLSPHTKYYYRVSLSYVAGGDPKARTAFEEFETLPNCTAEGYCSSFTPEEIEGNFKEPDAVAVDHSGDIFVADSGHDRVLEFNSQHEYVNQFGSPGSGEEQFEGIGGIATNSAGDIYVSDYGNSRVEEYSPAGKQIAKFGTPGETGEHLWEPTGIAVDASGDVWVRNTYGALLQEFSAGGSSHLASIGTAGYVQFGEAGGLAISGSTLYVPEPGSKRVQKFSTSTKSSAGEIDAGGEPWAIAVAPNGSLCVSEFNRVLGSGDRVQEFNSAGSPVKTFGASGAGVGQFSRPGGIAVGPSGAIYVADTGNDRVEELAAALSYATSITPANDIEGAFKEPDAAAVDPSGDIFVADSGHDRVLEFNYKREYLRQFGSPGSGEEQFEGIGGIAANAAGDVYVSDYGNGRIEEYSPAGVLLRKFGTPGETGEHLYEPTGIAIEPGSEDVWVRNTYGALLQKFSPTGTWLTSIGTAGYEMFGEAGGLAFSNGTLYVPEPANKRVLEFSTSTNSSSYFDQGGEPWAIAVVPSTGELYVSEFNRVLGSGDRVQEFNSGGSSLRTIGAPGSGAGQFSRPQGIAVGPSGYFFIVDSGNNRIEQWSLP